MCLPVGLRAGLAAVDVVGAAAQAVHLQHMHTQTPVRSSKSPVGMHPLLAQPGPQLVTVIPGHREAHQGGQGEAVAVGQDPGPGPQAAQVVRVDAVQA